MLKSVTDNRRLVFHNHLWLRLLKLSCGHHQLVYPEFKVTLGWCAKCNGKAKNWRM